MKKMIILILVSLVMYGMCACASTPKDGTVTVKDAKGNSHAYQIVEIGTNKDGKTCIYIQGKKEQGGKQNDVCAYTFQGGGFGWDVYIGAAITVDGKSCNAVKTTPYLSTLPGNLVSFAFDTSKKPDTITVFYEKNPEGGMTVNVSELSLDSSLAVSDKIATIAD